MDGQQHIGRAVASSCGVLAAVAALVIGLALAVGMAVFILAP